jgi:ADP-dependent NAD(P)H-hydrate dehydratase / NAD(P)H-hydrate epimerase
MQPLLTFKQIREGDAYTIANEPITSINLMERASKAFTEKFIALYPDKNLSVSIYCGTGNNGGDGLAIARMLKAHRYKSVDVKVARFSEKSTDDFKTNFQRLVKTTVPIIEMVANEAFPEEDADLVIDALLGTGLNKPLEGDYKNLVEHLNSLNKTIIAVDVPTGLFSDVSQPANSVILKADNVITFQQPKINFLLPESGPFIKKWEAVDIGIDGKYLASVNSPYRLVQEPDIKKMLKPRRHFSNKGTYGHSLIIAGQPETMGAALLSASACVYAGSGLTTACVPADGLTALNSYMPEIMAIVRRDKTVPEIKWDVFTTIGIGPGLGKEKDTLALLKKVLKNFKKPVAIDADALNLLSIHKELLTLVPQGSILTPHMKEFDRLFGDHESWWERVQTGVKKAKELKLIILLKNDYTLIFTPEGKAFFNSTSNAAMAGGGMGDVLTGIITALLAQQYSPEEAAVIGAFVHGKAGDELALPHLLNVVLPAQVAAHIPVIMAKLMA